MSSHKQQGINQYNKGKEDIRKEFLEMIKRFDYDKNNIAIIEFKDLLTKTVKGRK